MESVRFYYLDGQEMLLGDKVCVDGEQFAHVDLIFTPGTELGEAYGCKDSPGFALKYEDGNYVVWNTTDFDLVLIERKK